MANRPVFVMSLDKRYCIRENVEFEFFSGFSDKQQKKSIQSFDIVNIGLHFFLKNVRPYAASCSEA